MVVTAEELFKGLVEVRRGLRWVRVATALLAVLVLAVPACGGRVVMRECRIGNDGRRALVEGLRGERETLLAAAEQARGRPATPDEEKVIESYRKNSEDKLAEVRPANCSWWQL